MTSIEFEQYKILVRTSFMEYIVGLYNKSQVTELDLKYEFDTRVWILGKAISVIFSYDLNDNNNFTTDQMLQWQTIMNNIMKTRRFVDFIIE